MAAAALVTSVVGLAGCGSTGISAGPLSASLGTAFARLYLLQQVEQGNPPPSLAGLDASATCRRSGSSTQTGAGDDWVCTITYHGVGLATSITATYDVNVQTDGCYAADADGPASINTPLGEEDIGEESRTITGLGYHQILNPLWLIDGCFNTT